MSSQAILSQESNFNFLSQDWKLNLPLFSPVDKSKTCFLPRPQTEKEEQLFDNKLARVEAYAAIGRLIAMALLHDHKLAINFHPIGIEVDF